MIPFLSVCAGIEAASVAWHPHGFQAALLSEIEGFPRAVLVQRQGAVDARRTGAARLGVPLWGDFTALRARHLRRLGIAWPAVLVGGTPCQDYSIAGQRASLSGARGNLTLSFVELADAIDNARRADGQGGGMPRLGKRAGCFLHRRQRLRCLPRPACGGRCRPRSGTAATMDPFGYGCWTPPKGSVAHFRQSIFRTGPTPRACVPCRRSSRRA